jgi:3-oxoacyl-[acyl-carrier-protein] synthase II
MRRVVVTGLGMVTPLGCGVEPTWKNLLEGKSGAARITDFEVEDLACKIACQIPRGDGSNGTYNPDQWMEPKEQRKVDPFIVYAMAAASAASTRPPSRSWSAGPGACRPSSSPAASSTWRAAMSRSPTG